MKKILCLTLTLMMLTGAAMAMPVAVNNPPALVTASDGDGEEMELALSAFQILGEDGDGKYLLYQEGKTYTVKAEDLNKVLAFTGDVPALGEYETIADGAEGDQVLALQEGLKTLGYISWAADGAYGVGTKKAVTAFQKAMGLPETGEADEVTRLLIQSMLGETQYVDARVDPEKLFAPIIGRTDVDIQPILDSGLTFEYDETSGEGFITDGREIASDLSGETDLDKYQVSVRFGLITREAEGGVTVTPAMKVSCLCVRRPVLFGATVKAGDKRGTGEVQDLKVRLEGVYTVEEGIVPLTQDMIAALAGAGDAGELKIRLEGQYQTFDLAAEDAQSPSMVGKAASQLQ